MYEDLQGYRQLGEQMNLLKYLLLEFRVKTDKPRKKDERKPQLFNMGVWFTRPSEYSYAKYWLFQYGACNIGKQSWVVILGFEFIVFKYIERMDEWR